MSNEYENGNKNGLVPISDEIPEDRHPVKKESGAEEYYDLPPTIRSRTLIWSVISVICGVLSLLLCPFYYVSYVLVAGAVVLALISRKNLGFFEKYSIMGIIFGIMGFVCTTFALVANLLGIFG